MVILPFNIFYLNESKIFGHEILIVHVKYQFQNPNLKNTSENSPYQSRKSCQKDFFG